ncbi:type II RES/Xre toxin-antitoxin system antitoxin [Hyphomicrobium sp. 2TAF46]|uniref:type II RES/Xre toxin-antitoxin system antitoxin n=1 Tax=Hyphomicrobium sp. 2TAF46 TaxID=3233019 RepID=UPI003F927F04
MMPEQAPERGTDEVVLQRTAKLLGGKPLLKRKLEHPIDIHEIIRDGLPPGSLTHLLKALRVLRRDADLEQVVGMSVRTMQRLGGRSKPLSPEQSGRTVEFAKVLARATEILGSQDEAERWMKRPALGLDRRLPIELLTTNAGADLVEDYLTRLEYGVYT